MKFIRKRNWKRILKFSIVGSISFVIDFFVLNVLSLFTGINKGFCAALFSVISFLVANVNSYFLNRKWTFKKNNANSRYKIFLMISTFGILINIFIIYTVTTLVYQEYFSDIVWLNISKFLATVLTSVFNYFGYKKYVFKK